MNDIFVTKPSLPEFDIYVDEIKKIWQTCHITNFGDEYKELINLIKNKFGYKYVDLQCNGHMTLQNILSCIESGEIITTSFSFVSTALAIYNSGHTPVFCDIDPNTYNIDVSLIEDLITPNTVAIVPVHVFGFPCDVNSIMSIAKKHNLKVVYDAAHAFGVRVNNTEIGEFGDASMFSFHATKVYNSIEGGMAVFSDEDWYNECLSRSNFGLKDGMACYNGLNSKMNEFQAAMGIVNLKNFEDNVEKRKIITNLYNESFADLSDLVFCHRDESIKYNYAYYPICFKESSDYSVPDFLTWCEEQSVFPRRYFYPAINDMTFFNNSVFKTPIARSVSERIVCLPIYADMTNEESKRVIDAVRGFFING